MWGQRQRWEGLGHQPRDAWSPRSWKRREGPSLEPVGGVQDTWTSDVWSPGQGRVNFGGFKPVVCIPPQGPLPAASPCVLSGHHPFQAAGTLIWVINCGLNYL